MRPGPRRHRDEQPTGVPRVDAGVLPITVGPVQRQPPLPPHRGPIAVRHGRGAERDLPALVRGVGRRSGRGSVGRVGRRRRRVRSRAARGQRELRGRRGWPGQRCASRTRSGTTSTSSARVGRPARPRASSGGRPTSSSPRWRAPRAATPESLQACADRAAEVWFPAPPLMHAAAQWTAFSGLHQGATIVLHDDAQRFDAQRDPRASPNGSG